jgi:hypothetical protein
VSIFQSAHGVIGEEVVVACWVGLELCTTDLECHCMGVVGDAEAVDRSAQRRDGAQSTVQKATEKSYPQAIQAVMHIFRTTREELRVRRCDLFAALTV